MSPLPFSPLRTWLIAQNTLREAVRQKLLHFFVGLAIALVVGAQGLRDFNFGAPELKFLADCGYGAMSFFGSAVVIAMTAQLFFSEIENRTALTVLAKPVWRAEFVLGKFLGVAAVIAGFCALLTLLLAGGLWLRQRELIAEFPEAFAGGATVHFPNVLLAGALQGLKLGVLGAFVLLVATFAQTQLFTVALGFFILLICHLQYLAQDEYRRSGSVLLQAVARLIAALFPNFQVFALADSLAAADAPAAADVARVVVYALAYALATTALAIFSFRRREI